MHTATFTELRRNARKYLDFVELGESISITRRGRVIARIIPETGETKPSWKKPALRLTIKGVELTKIILDERESSGR
jgi:prevent-host-death family protein